MAQDQKLKGVLDKARRDAEERDAKRRADAAGVSYINLDLQPVETDALELIPEAQAREAKIATIEKKGDRVVFTSFDVQDLVSQKIQKDLEHQGLKLTI